MSQRAIPPHPVPRLLLRRPAFALAVGVASFLLTAIQGCYREGFDPWQQAVSALSLGPDGWLQMINLTAFGLVLLTTVGAWHRILGGARGGRSYPLLTALVGLAFVGVGVIPQDPAPGYNPDGVLLAAPTPLGLAHLTIAGVAAISSVGGLLVMARRFARDPLWRHWPLYSSLTALTVVACVIVYGVWSLQPTGFAGTFERAAMIAPMLWMFTFLRRLYRGAPLMVSGAIGGARRGPPHDLIPPAV